MELIVEHSERDHALRLTSGDGERSAGERLEIDAAAGVDHLPEISSVKERGVSKITRSRRRKRRNPWHSV